MTTAKTATEDHSWNDEDHHSEDHGCDCDCDDDDDNNARMRFPLQQ